MSYSPSTPSHPLHSLVVEKVSSALDTGEMEEDCDDEDDDYSDEEDEEMPDDDVPEDSMTLVQYLEEARREALIRKGSQYSDVSTKKGRLEVGGPSS